MNSIYFERQSGDLCRMHSLNAYFGYKRIDKNQFIKLCNEYDTIISGLKSDSMDGFSEGRCIISYVLDKYDSKYTLLIPINSYNGIRNHIDIPRYNKLIKNINCFFEFNKGHIWFNRIINNKWYKIDSISGITNINKPNIDSNGYLIVIDDKILYNEIYYYLNYITSNPSLDLSYIQLYYCIKIIKLKKIENDSDYNFKIYLLNKIKEHLTIFIKLNRNNKNTKSIKQKILHCIKLFNSNI